MHRGTGLLDQRAQHRLIVAALVTVVAVLGSIIVAAPVSAKVLHVSAPPGSRTFAQPDLAGYCKSIGSKVVAPKQMEAPGAADDWRCGSKQLDMDAACRYTFKGYDVFAGPIDPDYADSWFCFERLKPTTTVKPRPTSTSTTAVPFPGPVPSPCTLSYEPGCLSTTRLGTFRITPSIVRAGETITGTWSGSCGHGPGGATPCTQTWDGFKEVGQVVAGCGTSDTTCTIRIPVDTPQSDYRRLAAGRSNDQGLAYADGYYAVRSASDATLSVADITITKKADGAVAGNFKVTLSSPSPVQVTAFVAIRGSAGNCLSPGNGYHGVFDTVRFSPGVTSQDVQVVILPDNTYHADQTLELVRPQQPVQRQHCQGRGQGAAGQCRPSPDGLGGAHQGGPSGEGR